MFIVHKRKLTADLFFKIEMFDLHAVSIFATGTGESNTTTPTPFFACCGTQFIEK
jgi:hypothetical protein